MSEHHIEERSIVWLRLEEGKWVIDSPSDDGYPLEGYDDGPLNEACECESPEGECDAVRDAAAEIPTPTLHELFLLLKEYYGDV